MMRFLSVPFLLLAAACAGSSTSSGYPPLDMSAVTVYASENQIPGEFEVISFLQPPRRRGYSPIQSDTDEMRAQAARLGANGLLLIDENSEVADARIAAAISQQGSYSRVQYVAIYVPDGTPDEARR